MDRTIEIHKWGSDLSGRALGELAREELETLIEDERPDGITIDLSAVEAMSTSFADECFGTLVRQMRESRTFVRLRFVGGTTDVRAVLRSVLARPSEQTITN